MQPILCISLVVCVVSFSFSAVLPKHWHESGGYSTEMEAGLGGKVIKVTNLDLKGEGSLKNAWDRRKAIY